MYRVDEEGSNLFLLYTVIYSQFNAITQLNTTKFTMVKFVVVTY